MSQFFENFFIRINEAQLEYVKTIQGVLLEELFRMRILTLPRFFFKFNEQISLSLAVNNAGDSFTNLKITPATMVVCSSINSS